MNRYKMDKMLVLAALIIAGSLPWSNAAPSSGYLESVVEGTHEGAAERVATKAAALDAYKEEALSAPKEAVLDAQKEAALNETGDPALDAPKNGTFKGAAFDDDAASTDDGAGAGATTPADGVTSAGEDGGNDTNTGNVTGDAGGRPTAGPDVEGTNNKVCGDGDCCYEHTIPVVQVEIRTSNGSASSTGTTVIKPDPFMIVLPGSHVCFNCFEVHKGIGVCDGLGEPTYWKNGEKVAVTQCGSGFEEADPLVTEKYSCTFEKDGSKTNGDHTFSFVLHQGKCPLPPHRLGATMEEYTPAEEGATAKYTCKADQTDITVTCQGDVWSDDQCAGPVVCEDWTKGFCDVYRPQCDNALFVQENCMKTCELCRATDGDGTTDGVDATGADKPSGTDATDQQAKATDAADRTLSTLALTIILPLITCALM